MSTRLTKLAVIASVGFITCASPAFAKKYKTSKSRHYRSASLSGYKGAGAKGRYGQYGLGVSKKTAPDYSGQYSYVAKLSLEAGLSGSSSSTHSQHGSSQESSITPMVGGMLGYGITKRLSADFMIMHMGDMGIMDPTLAFSYLYPLSTNFRLIPVLQSSAPLSEMSQQMGLMTQTVAKIGALYLPSPRTRLFANLKSSYSFYNTGSSSDDQSSMGGMDSHDHSTHGGSSGDQHQMGDGSSGNNSTMDHGSSHDINSSSQQGGMNHENSMDHSEGMTGMNLATMQNDHSGHDMNSGNGMDHSMMMKRQSTSAGIDFGYFQGYNQNWQFGSRLDYNRLSYDDGSADWASTAVLAELYYATQGFMDMGTSTMPMGLAGFTSINFAERSANLTIVPTNAAFVVGLAYGGM